MASLPNARAFVKGPAGYTQREPIAAAVLIWLLLVALSSARRGSLPTQRDAVSIAVATGVIVIAAAIAPRLVTLFLLVVAVVMALKDANGISTIVDSGFARIRSAVGQ